MNKEQFEVEIEHEGERLDKYLNLIFEEKSRSFFQKLIKEGQVLVNDTAQKANYRLKVEDIVTMTIPDAVETPIVPENIPLDILYEDEDVLGGKQAEGNGRPSVCRTLHRYACKCDHVSLQGQFIRDQRRNPPGHRTPHRYGYDRFPDRVQK